MGLNLYFQKILITGRDNIPTTGAVMFTVNHQNAFLDALLVASTNKRHTHFLVRADVFKFKLVRKLFSSLNMMPVYRIRDGRQQLFNNHQIFEKCFAVLQGQQAIMLFPEANHHQKRLLLPLSKGFTRIALGVEKPITIVPVGINYTHHRLFGGSVNVNYGASISTAAFINGDGKSQRTLTDQVQEAMQQLIICIPDNQDYQKYEDYLNQRPRQYLNPSGCNKWVRQTAPSDVPLTNAQPAEGFLRTMAKGWSLLLNFPPLFISTQLLSRLSDPVFNSSIKFLTGILILPIYYLLLWSVLFLFAGPEIALWFLILAILSLFIRKWTLRY